MEQDRVRIKAIRLLATAAIVAIMATSVLAVATSAIAKPAPAASAQPTLDAGWREPPNQARLRAYWWWLNGNVDKAAITNDLEQMKAKGFGGAVIFDAGGAGQNGNGPTPRGPTFFSPQWRELYKHTLSEANRLGLEMSLNIMSGWNLGGPMVKPEDAVKQIVWSEATVQGPGKAVVALPRPQCAPAFYRDLYVLAYPMGQAGAAPPSQLKNWRAKALIEPPKFSGRNAWFLVNSAPDTAALLSEDPARPGEEATRLAQVVDVTRHMTPDGALNWNAPSGKWQILRFGCTLGKHCRVSTNSDGWDGYAIDVLDEGAFRRYWDAVVKPLLDDAGPLAGKTLRYLHTDSWEIDNFNWTPSLPAEFHKRRGYGLVPWLPTLAGRIVEDRDQSNRFLFDFRKTLGELAIDHHYKLMKRWAAQYGVGIHPESGGPHYTTIDAQECLGLSDVPMSEFWANSPTHRVDDVVRFFVKQPASAAHVNGHPFVAAEGFTNVGLHWQETLWDNLKPTFDLAITEGLNRLVWHAFVCSPASTGVPGQQYFAGTHLNPKVTWWSRSQAFFGYIDRCQWMMQQGRPVADACYYYGDNVPNYAQLRASDPAKLGPGYDYDAIDERAILDRLGVKNGRLALPDGMSYRLLVLPPYDSISLPVLRKLKALVNAGATIVGAQPRHANGLAGFPASDAEAKSIGDAVWRGKTGKGRVLAGMTGRQALLAVGVKPDFEFSGGTSGTTQIHFIHRRDGHADIYFVASRAARPETLRCTFRVGGKAPELWDPVTGQARFATDYAEADGRASLPIQLGPYGSVFVVFRAAAAEHPATGKPNWERDIPRQELTGPWTVAFDPKWGGPAQATFPALVSWTDRPEPGIRYYSGTATYRKTFDLPSDLAGKSLVLDLGKVRELAEVRLNSQSLGIAWNPPYRVNLGNAAKPGANALEIDVVNFWPNRIIGDQKLPASQRLTRTNIRKLTSKTPLMPSGLFGPVQILEREPSTLP
jgi:hypothetical protein